MRRAVYGLALVAHGLFGACSDEGGGDGGPGGGGATGGTRAGSGGNGGGAGSSGAAGSSAAAGGTAGTAGTPGDAGSAGASGAAGNGGAAGVGALGGAGGAAAGEAGMTNEAGMTGEAGMPGAAGEVGAPGEPVVGLSWPVDCIPGQTCDRIGYPDVDDDGDAYDCSDPGYFGHEGTDIDTAAGTAVRAAADGVVLFAFDGKYDQCPNVNEPDCQDPPGVSPGSTVGNTVCTPSGPYCGTGTGDCFWCFAGGNVIVIRHEGVPGVFATRYDHLKKNSVLVEPGDLVTRGQKLAEVGSAGSSTTPHLHFEVWGTGFYELTEPWAGACGPNFGPSLWAYDPPWRD